MLQLVVESSPDELVRSIHRNILFLAFVLAYMPQRAATYQGLKEAMGMSSERAVRALVSRAWELGWVQRMRQKHLGHTKVLVRISPFALQVLEMLFNNRRREVLRA